jgi:hypothetical protein
VERGKWFVFGFLLALIITSLGYILHVNRPEATLFLAQSVVDNAIFCGMFIIVVIVTGINC